MSATSVLRRPQVSPLRYPGGKGALTLLLRSILRHNGLRRPTYVEPYAGGAGAGLALLVTGEVDRLVINDLDPAIYAFWQALTSDPNEFRRRIETAKLSVREWTRQKEILRNPLDQDPMDLGFATFFLNRTNRSGMLTGGPIGGLDQSGTYKIDARFNRTDLAERVRLIGLHSRRILVSRRDGIEVVRESVTADETFIYADPPYFEKAGKLYLNSFADHDHLNLATVLNESPQAAWVLTYDAVPQVDDLYALRSRFPISLRYSAHRVINATETMVLSDRLAMPPRED